MCVMSRCRKKFSYALLTIAASSSSEKTHRIVYTIPYCKRHMQCYLTGHETTSGAPNTSPIKWNLCTPSLYLTPYRSRTQTMCRNCPGSESASTSEASNDSCKSALAVALVKQPQLLLVLEICNVGSIFNMFHEPLPYPVSVTYSGVAGEQTASVILALQDFCASKAKVPLTRLSLGPMSLCLYCTC